jgi:hypothetical protein
MKVSMRVTLDGLLRALRWRAHNIADELSMSRRPGARGAGSERRAAHRPGTREHGDDRARR